MKTFDDLEFSPHPTGLGGKIAQMDLGNGYKISVVGGGRGLYGDGETTFEEIWFKKNYKRFGFTETLAKENVKEKIQNIDKCFLDFAPRFEEKKNLFRGILSLQFFLTLNR